MTPAFEFSTVVHLIEPTGLVAHDLEELRSGIEQSDFRSLFCHTHQRLLRHPQADELPPNDYASWCEHMLHEPEAAERLEFGLIWRAQGLEALRQGLLGALEELIRSGRGKRGVPPGLEFRFHRSHTLSLSTGMVAQSADEAADYVATLDVIEFFYHFYEVPTLEPGTQDDVLAWLRAIGAERRARSAEETLSSWSGLMQIRKNLLRRWRRSGIAGRLASRATMTEAARQGEAHELVAHLVRGWRGNGTIETEPPREE